MWSIIMIRKLILKRWPGWLILLFLLFVIFFKKATQITFTEFVNRYRINKACLLMAQDKTISECSYSCGFNNVTYFNRMFKKYTGKTPSEFIKNYSDDKINVDLKIDSEVKNKANF
ncbi:helix-turn-helix transcriptional regulator [Chryseobacterium sp. P1-3]|uniref:helix-turn-helix domain-containing protein n=1 Tax=Chryseobacterium sp. (strain P1-3) TaxID=1517683 RepID=UPI002934C2B6|nr:helix-turn-helix transcriptional regulator [Chryseobacterium sp. P1-3]